MSRGRRILLVVAGGLMFLTAFFMLFTLLSTAVVEQGQIVQHLSETRAALERENAAMEEAIAVDSAVPRLQERARALGFITGGNPGLFLPITLPAEDPGP